MSSKDAKACGLCAFVSNEAAGFFYLGTGLAAQVLLLGISALLAVGVTSVIGADANGNGGRPKKK